jgi:tRNA G18 (ribose-2'-O)-methylase SpoU
MRRPQGFALTTEPGKPDIAEDTFTCAHCNFLVFVQPFQDPSEMGGFCRMCMMHICGPCADKGSCDPFEKKLERMEARGRFLEHVLNNR